MSIIQAIFLGVIQGLAEFLPISSSGHLTIFQNIIALPNLEESYVSFDILLHFGTLVAVFIVYFKTIINIIKEFFIMLARIFKGTFKWRKANRYQKMGIFIILATLVLIPVVFIQDYIKVLFSSLLFTGFMLLVTAALLWIADHSPKGTKDLRDMTAWQSIKIGLFQAFAILPGVSRSGSTISAAINMGFKRKDAVEFSFILAIPAVIGANILNIKDLVNIQSNLLLPYLLGTIAAVVFGILAIKLVNWLIKKDRFGIFIYYCVIAGLFAIILSFIRFHG